MKVKKRILNQEHKDILDNILLVGLAYELKGKYDAIELLYREAL
jgi:hypothetical protein